MDDKIFERWNEFLEEQYDGSAEYDAKEKEYLDSYEKQQIKSNLTKLFKAIVSTVRQSEILDNETTTNFGRELSDIYKRIIRALNI